VVGDRARISRRPEPRGWHDRWVQCADCGFIYEEVLPEDVPVRLRSVPAAFRARVDSAAHDAAAVIERPRPEVWSALEYACHVRDVLIAQRERVLLALVEDRPEFAPMHRDERVLLAAYAEEPPELVLAGIESAAVLLARVVERLTPEQLSRPCVYRYPERAERDILWIGRHTLHECHHHLLDIDRGLGSRG
jgi:S-DNA-T family DNA segregation ATPase FtsK/SpoIIIE